MEKLLALFSFFIFIGCSNVNYISDPGTRVEEVTNEGKIVIKYNNLTTLENDRIICKNGQELNGKFTGTIIYREKLDPKTSDQLRTRLVEQNFKSGDLNSIKVNNFETLDKNGNFTIYNGIFDKNKKFTGEMETVLFYDIGIVGEISPDKLINFNKDKFYKETGVNLLYEYTLRGIVEKAYLKNDIILKKELIFKLYSEEIKEYNFDFVFYSEEIKDGIKIVYASNMYKNVEEILDKYFKLLEENQVLVKTNSKNKKYIDKREKKIIKQGKNLDVEDIVTLMPISILLYNEAGIKKIPQEITLKYNIKSNKLLETKYIVNNNIIDTKKMSKKEKEEIVKNIVANEKNNIKKKFTDIYKERVRIYERQRKIDEFMAGLELALNQLQQQQVQQQKQIKQQRIIQQDKDTLFKLQMKLENLKLNQTPFSTNSEREIVRSEMWKQMLDQHYGF